jgi:histidinol phosphatase-like PHP family hydrolase
VPITNADLSEILAEKANDHDPASNRHKALRRAARSALFAWDHEAAQLVERGRPLIELPSVGPWLADVIGEVVGGNPPDGAEPPPVRRGFLSRAEVRSTLDQNPSWADGLRGDLQMHTTYSDGGATLEQMVGAAASFGHEYVNITDHSKELKIARGMDEARLAQQGAEIAALNRELEGSRQRIRVLHGIEMNLSPEGRGDMDPASLGALDLVLGAFHSKLRLKEDQTERYLAAMRNRDIDVLAHPRGRIYNVRAGLSADWGRVFAEAVRRGKALEIDANPYRQDLDPPLLELAVEAGAWISIGTDAHSPGELRNMEYGIALAIGGGVPTERILNFLTRDGIRAWVEQHR